MNRKMDIWFGVSTRDGEGGKKDNIIHIPALWADWRSSGRTQIVSTDFGTTVLNAVTFWTANTQGEISELGKVSFANFKAMSGL